MATIQDFIDAAGAGFDAVAEQRNTDYAELSQGVSDANTKADGAVTGLAALEDSLGDASTKDVGTGSGTVAAGDDSRLLSVENKLWTARTLADLADFDTDAQQVQCQSRDTEQDNDGYAGIFKWVRGDQSGNVAADPLQGVWVAPSGAPTGASGAWRRVHDRAIIVEWFGAQPYTEDAWRAANGDVVDSSAAFKAALDLAGHMGGGEVQALGQFYLIENLGLRIPPNVVLSGSGYGTWRPSFSNPKTWGGTNLVFKGTDPAPIQVPGVTSMKHAGGWRADPDNASRIFKLNSLMNEDANAAVPATPKALKVAVANRDTHAPVGVRYMRVVPWIGSDGISIYESTDTASTELGDDWDIGILLNDTEYSECADIQIRGYWREYGFLQVSGNQAQWGHSEGNVVRHVSAQGYCGLGVRSGDVWKVLSSTTNSVTIRWSEESYWPSSGRIELLGAGFTTYTGLSRSGDELTFTGVAADASGVTQVRNGYRGTGFSTGVLENCEGWGLWHHSGKKAEELGLGVSKGSEFSGFPLRGLHGVNCSFFGEAASGVAAFFHDCDDAVFLGGKFELGHVIASPIETSAATVNPLAVAAQGATLNLRTGACFTSSTSTALFTPRSGQVDWLQLNPPDRNNTNMLLEPLPSQDLLVRLRAARRLQVLKSDGSTPTAIFHESGNMELRGQLSLGVTNASGFLNYNTGFGLFIREGTTTRVEVQSAGHVLPGADGTQTLGSPTKRWSTGYFRTARIDNLPVYADNTAAAAGGLAVGDLYRTATGQVMARYS